MLTPITVLTAVLALSSITDSAAYAQECEEDHQCPDNQFCYASTGVCAPCIVCAAYNRKEPNQHCAREWQDCGGCVPGFRSETIPGAGQRGNCVAAPQPRVDSPPPTASGGVKSVSSAISQQAQIIIVAAMGLALASGTVYLAIKGRQRMRRQQPDIECGRSDGDIPLIRRSAGLAVDSSNQDRPPPSPDRDRDPVSPPPAYSRLKDSALFGPARPTAPPSYCEGSECRHEITMDVTVREAAEEKLQQAQPFHVPGNARFRLSEGGGEVEVVQEEAEEEEDIGAQSQSASARSTPVNLNEDDTTMPSSWAPAVDDLHGGGSLEDSGVCNFSESPSSSMASLQDSPAPTSFHGMFADGELVSQTIHRDSSEAEAEERPAKRLRVDSGSHSAESSSSEDESLPKASAIGNV